MSRSTLPITLLCSVALALLVSGLQPYDRLTWLMETLPVMIAAPILVATHRRFPLTPLLASLVAVHALILILGGTYTYARVPLGFELQELFGFERNPYDRIGHFFQGLVPTLAAREIFLRLGYVRGRMMSDFLALCVAMTVSACYELIEWAAAVMLGQGANEFLGTQGDIWDTQSDMALALCGALCSIVLIARWHDRQMRGLVAS